MEREQWVGTAADLVQVGCQWVGDPPVNGDLVRHAGVASHGEVLHCEDGAWERVQQLILLRDKHRQHPGIVMPAQEPCQSYSVSYPCIIGIYTPALIAYLPQYPLEENPCRH